MVVLGDLGDINAVGRRDGFEDALKGKESMIEVVSRVPQRMESGKSASGASPMDFRRTRTSVLFSLRRIFYFLPSPRRSRRSAATRKLATRAMLFWAGLMATRLPTNC